jgi:anti-sigma regulatory factor (Ser/Thr protein kinase)
MSDQVNVTYWGFRCENASAAPPFRRHFRRVIDVLTAEGSDRFAAELIFGELVGNVVRHSPGPIEVRLEFSDRTTILSVTDEGEPFDPAAELPEDPWADSGRGLFLVHALGSPMEIKPRPERGKTICVELDLRLVA